MRATCAPQIFLTLALMFLMMLTADEFGLMALTQDLSEMESSTRVSPQLDP